MATFDVAFKGGGIKGAAFVGALAVLERSGHRFRRLIGTSAGAITAALLAAGYTPDQALELMTEKKNGQRRFFTFLDLARGADIPPEARDQCATLALLKRAVAEAVKSKSIHDHVGKLPLPLRLAAGGLFDRLSRPLLDALLENPDFAKYFYMLESGALFVGMEFVRWMEERLETKGLKRGVRLGEMYEATKRDVSLVATDTTAKEVLVLNHRTAPQCPVAWAVRMSMSIPLVWGDVAWQKEWGAYLKKPRAGHRIVDGGVLVNFPLRFLVQPDEESREVLGPNEEGEKAPPLGLFLDERLPVPGAEVDPPLLREIPVVQNGARLIDTVTEAWDQRIVEKYKDVICFIPTKGFSSLEFGISDERLDMLVNSGRCAMLAHLKQRGLPAK
jgi:predicted acylesterase/phospholipase RssA